METRFVTGSNIVFGGAARSQMLRGADALANAVKVTLGPRGRNVLLETDNEGPRVTKDGATIAGQIEFSNKLANIGARLLREVAVETGSIAGDGTSTATVLANSILLGGEPPFKLQEVWAIRIRQLQANSDRADFLELERGLLPDELSLVPGRVAR